MTDQQAAPGRPSREGAHGACGKGTTALLTSRRAPLGLNRRALARRGRGFDFPVTLPLRPGWTDHAKGWACVIGLYALYGLVGTLDRYWFPGRGG